MIPDIFVGIILFFANTIIDILPSLPQLPSVITDATNFIFTYLSQAVSFLAYLYTPAFLIAIFAMMVAYFAFDIIVRIATWALRIFSEVMSIK